MSGFLGGRKLRGEGGGLPAAGELASGAGGGKTKGVLVHAGHLETSKGTTSMQHTTSSCYTMSYMYVIMYRYSVILYQNIRSMKS